MEAEYKPERNHEDEVTEAGLESFPASDPPAFNQSGGKHDTEDTMGLEERERAPPDPVKRRSSRRLLINGIAIVLAVAILVWLVLR